jgi:hypothetical protein
MRSEQKAGAYLERAGYSSIETHRLTHDIANN